jgi:hypothetical protein
MTWVKLDDQFSDHPKIEAAGPLAAWLFVCGLCYCSKHLTDGFIPATKAARLADVPTSRKHIDRLVALGLWAEVEDGYRIRDYLDYQPSAEKKREARVDAGRRGGQRSGQTRSKPASKPASKTEANDEANDEAKSNGSRTPYPLVTDSSYEESLPPDRPRTDLVVVPSPTASAEDARALTCAFWERSNPKPAVKFIALLKLVERFLEAGWPGPAISRALVGTRAYTVDAIEFTLNAQRPEERRKPKSFDVLERRAAAHLAAEGQQ